jgi:hypothetical protein
LAGTRPWVRPGTTTADGVALRYTARGDEVHAFVREPTAVLRLSDVAATPTTRVTGPDGTARAWRDTGDGIEVDLGAGAPSRGPATVTLHAVTARP